MFHNTIEILDSTIKYLIVNTFFNLENMVYEMISKLLMLSCCYEKLYDTFYWNYFQNYNSFLSKNFATKYCIFTSYFTVKIKFTRNDEKNNSCASKQLVLNIKGFLSTKVFKYIYIYFFSI